MEINTKEIVERWKEKLLEEVSELELKPLLLIIVAKDYSAPSSIYVRNKVAMANEIGVDTEIIEIDWQGRSREELLVELKNIIKNASVMKCLGGIIIQDPFPELTQKDMGKLIPSKFDVDGFSNEQIGKLISGDETALAPATAQGVFDLLKEVTTLEGKYVAIVNRSNLIGKPLYHLLLQANATPICLHTKTDEHTKLNALEDVDIVITGCGRRKIFDSDILGYPEVIIDCSMYKEEGIANVGDCDKEDILECLPKTKIASGYGHTGATTCFSVISNTVKAFKQNMKENNI